MHRHSLHRAVEQRDFLGTARAALHLAPHTTLAAHKPHLLESGYLPLRTLYPVPQECMQATAHPHVVLQVHCELYTCNGTSSLQRPNLQPAKDPSPRRRKQQHGVPATGLRSLNASRSGRGIHIAQHFIPLNGPRLEMPSGVVAEVASATGFQSMPKQHELGPASEHVQSGWFQAL